jgi:hypothetical protein
VTERNRQSVEKEKKRQRERNRDVSKRERDGGEGTKGNSHRWRARVERYRRRDILEMDGKI